MPTTIEVALASLLPAISFLPPNLISLSNSLLAQSRAKAASLKPEEEIARTYACCHIACDRLRKRHNLEIGRPAPPVKPRVYEKLHRYLDGVLTTPVTPRKGRGLDQDVDSKQRRRTPGSIAKTPTSTAKKTGEELATTTPTTGEKRRRIVQSEVLATKKDGEEVPRFAMPLVRALCKATGHLSAVPHVLVGAESVLREIISRHAVKADEGPARKKRRTPQSAKSTSAASSEVAPASGIAVSRWPALLIALYLLVAAKMRDLDTEDEAMKATRTESADAVRKFCTEQTDTLPSNIDASLSKLESNIGFYILEGEDYGWLDMEWYQNVPAGQQIAEQEYCAMDGQMIDNGEQDDVPTPRPRPHKTPLGRKEKHGGKNAVDFEDMIGPAGLQYGLGTMFQPAVDWLSDERRKDFVPWKKDILEKMNALDAIEAKS